MAHFEPVAGGPRPLDLKGSFMKKMLILSVAALLASLPANAGVSIDRSSPSFAACGFGNPAQVFRQVLPSGGCDAGGPGPIVEAGATSFGLVPNDNIDALSANTPSSPDLQYHLIFSADRASLGQVGTPFRAEAANGQAASDLWWTNLTGGTLVGSMAGGGCVPWAIAPPHVRLANQTAYNLIRTAAAGVAVAPPQDNVDAVELDVLDTNGDGIHDVNAYFSLDAASPSLGGWSPATLFFSAAGSGAFVPFSITSQIGLAADDDIDALVMWDSGVIGSPDPGVDYVLFSLAPGSPTLTTYGVSPAMIFVSDFTGRVCPFDGPGPLGLLPADNVDGLDALP